MNEIKMQSEIEGYYKLVVHKADADGNPIPGTERIAADWFKNLILDQGLNRIGASPDYISRCQVGSGSTAPANAQTALVTWIAGTSTQQSNVTGATSSSPYYGYITRTFRFAAGVAAGNLSEVGVGWATSGAALFSRALIVDGGGSPTTITILSDEVLDVSYQIRCYAHEADLTGSITLGGTSYAWTSRPAYASTYDPLQGWALETAQNNSRSATYCKAYTGSIGAITAGPSGAIGGNAASIAATTYANDSHGKSTLSWGLDDGNNVSGIGAIMFPLGFCEYQIGFVPNIPKDNTKVLSLTMDHTWARH